MSKPQNYQPRMDKIFELFEYPIFELLERVDHKLSVVTKEASISGVPHDFREEYVRRKLVCMIDQISENRESKVKAERTGGRAHENIYHS